MATQTTKQPAYKTYVLDESMDTNAPIYQQVGNGQREHISKIPRFSPYLQLTVLVPEKDEKGETQWVNRVIRYKGNSNFVFQHEQLEKEKIDANAKFTQQERDERVFKNGFLVTNKPILQKYLEIYPGFDGSPAQSDEVAKKQYRLLDKGNEEKVKNVDAKRRIKAANRIIDMEELSALQGLLIRLNGSFFNTPDEIGECQNLLIAYIEDANDDMLDKIEKETSQITIDESTSILLGKLLNADHLSFNAVEGKISKKDKKGGWIELRTMSNEYSLEERLRLFSDFLNTEDGRLLKKDLENDLTEIEGTKKNKDKPLKT